MTTKSPSIGTLKENSLHASLKSLLAQEGDLLESPVQGYLIDIVRDDLLVEIQTRNFSAIKKKLTTLLDEHPVRLVYPIAQQKWIVKEDPVRGIVRRKSPRRGRLEDVFYELVHITALLRHPGFSLHILLVEVEEIHVPADQVSYTASWRRKGWAVGDRRLLAVKEQVEFNQAADYLAFLVPLTPDKPFTAWQLSQQRQIPGRLGARMVYTLSRMAVIEKVGKIGRRNLYRQNPLLPPPKFEEHEF